MRHRCRRTIGAAFTEIANSSVSAVRGTGVDNVSNSYEQKVLAECRTLANGRYPFVAGSTNDIPIADFDASVRTERRVR